MFYALLIIAVLLIAAELIAANKNRQIRRANGATVKWQKAYRWRWVIGIPFAVVSVFVSYPMSGDTESYRVFGFPLMVAAFDEAGSDYVGPFTAPAFFANSAIWYFLPQIALYIWSKAVRENHEASQTDKRE